MIEYHSNSLRENLQTLLDFLWAYVKIPLCLKTVYFGFLDDIARYYGASR